jgi:hypothetical protein
MSRASSAQPHRMQLGASITAVALGRLHPQNEQLCWNPMPR